MNILSSPVPGSRPRKEEESAALDRVFGAFLCRTAESRDDALYALGTELIRRRREGHSFIFLSPEELSLLEKYPCLTDERNGLLVRDDDKLYLRREFRNEESVARAVAGLLKKPLLPGTFTDEEIDSACGKKLNPEQHRAVRNALTRSFALISGGPGTGKSTIIAAVAELELRQRPRSVIRITAPTGKAAELLADDLARVLPGRNLTTSTLHRLFRGRALTGEFGVDAEDPLECDLLIVDECSMIPLGAAADMFRGLRPETRVVLSGDHRQLESIESGAVLSELLSARENAPDSLLARAGVELTENYRSSAAPRIQYLAAEIRRGSLPEEKLRDLLTSENTDDYCFLSGPPQEKMLETARRCWGELPGTASTFAPDREEKAFGLLASFRVLTANREGPEGCGELNRMILRTLGLRSLYAPGSALMVTRNSPAAGLANGDVGIVFAFPDGSARIVFRNGRRAFAPHELPPHESAFATTVHKAQGSGFEELFFLLPREDSPLLTRELFYTALTRAKKKITVAGKRESVLGALKRKSSRNSCLARRIIRLLEDEKNDL